MVWFKHLSLDYEPLCSVISGIACLEIKWRLPLPQGDFPNDRGVLDQASWKQGTCWAAKDFICFLDMSVTIGWQRFLCRWFMREFSLEKSLWGSEKQDGRREEMMFCRNITSAWSCGELWRVDGSTDLTPLKAGGPAFCTSHQRMAHQPSAGSLGGMLAASDNRWCIWTPLPGELQWQEGEERT